MAKWHVDVDDTRRPFFIPPLNRISLERGTFTKFQLDQICSSLSPDEWINPHRSFLGLGNYDVNVILSAVQLKGYEAVWFDKRK